MVDLAVREADFKGADTLERKRHASDAQPRKEMLLPYRVGMAFKSDDAAARTRILQEVRQTKSWESNGVAWALMDLDELAAAEQVLRMGLDPQRPEELRRTVPARMHYLELRRGRWSAARTQQATLRRQPGTNAGRDEAFALAAALPFLPVPRADIEAARARVAQSDSVPPSDATEPVAALRAHKRLYLLGVLSARLEDYKTALALAARLEALPAPPDLRVVVTSLANGVRASVAWQQQQPKAALAALQRVSAEMPIAALYDPVLAQERERYIRAEALYRLGRENEALPWYTNAFEGTEHGALYRAACYLRIAQIQEKLGDTEKAADYYARFLELWDGADPQLAPLIQSARRRLADITGETR